MSPESCTTIKLGSGCFPSDTERIEVPADCCDLEPLRSFTRLRSLDLSEAYRVRDFSPLRALTSLERLDLSRLVIGDLDVLSGLTRLEEIDLDGSAVTDIAPLAHLPRLRSLATGGRLSDPGQLSCLTALEQLFLHGQEHLTDLSVLAPLSSLVYLDLLDTRARDLSPLTNLTALRELVAPLWIEDISPVSSLKNLERLSLWGSHVSDLGPVGSLHRLKSLDVMGSRVIDLSVLHSLSHLERVNVLNTAVTLESVAGLRLAMGRGTVYSNFSEALILEAMRQAGGTR